VSAGALGSLVLLILVQSHDPLWTHRNGVMLSLWTWKDELMTGVHAMVIRSKCIIHDITDDIAVPPLGDTGREARKSNGTREKDLQGIQVVGSVQEKAVHARVLR
jgi:hypothetical protein